ncbi:hypothetical protein [Aquincola tertiaricarbonis]|uniref:hypothetical protein n=1 Tax=Aquincola tertiaricarbonis TaxID=391953 RepID=UPI000614E0A1|nr:hypothetical protein [Aquincola tertiaricarbonis]
MNIPTPALVAQRAAQPLPRWALWLFCAAYLLPGVVGRDPWKNADLTAFGVMAAMAEGRTSWLSPSLGGLPVDTALLPHWLGAAFIWLLTPWIDAPMAARIPYALLLALTLALTWYATFQLARTEAAQPVAFAFGGEATPVDYARALADGAILALMATLGALQLGHETTPELAQLASVALAVWALAAAPFRGLRPRLAILAALPLLAACGAPAMAMALGAIATVLCARSGFDAVRRFMPWVAAATLAAALVGATVHSWAWRIDADVLTGLPRIGRLLVWFLWPAWLLALWTAWRWRRHLQHRHISVPLAVAGLAVVASVAMGGSDRALMLGLPGFAVLAAFALPTLKRGTSAAIDWFSVFFFSACAIGAWVVYAAFQTGVPAKTAANVAKLAPGFSARFSLVSLLFAIAGTVAWIGLVRWRTGRHQHALWKSLVLPAGGVALCWLLLMTLWLPLLDYARSYRPWTERLARHVPAGACVITRGLPLSAVASLEYFGRWRVVAHPRGTTELRSEGSCQVLLVSEIRGRPQPAPAGWRLVARENRPTDRDEVTAIYRRP